MASKTGRAVAGFFAGLFIISAVAFPAAVIYSNFQQNKSKPDPAADTNQPTDAEKKALEAAQAQNKEKNVTALKGTQLANFTPVANIPQLQSTDTTPGTGDTIKESDKITVDYTGAIAATGVVFESSLDSGQKATFGLDQVIKGWTKGIPGMKVGGTRRLLIPAELAYGPQGNSTIPANSDLVFDVTVHSISK